MARFDHIEAHVKDVASYCDFLRKLFEGGSHQVIADDGTAMFTSHDGLRIEVKHRNGKTDPVMSGICNPCLRRKQPEELLAKLGLAIDSVGKSAEGKVLFFTDKEGIVWHIKDLL